MTQHFGARHQKEIESMKDVTTSSVKRMLKRILREASRGIKTGKLSSCKNSFSGVSNGIINDQELKALKKSDASDQFGWFCFNDES